MAKTLLILGASYVGLTIAHKALKNTFKTVQDYQVILINPSTHHYWNLASVRAIVPGQISDEKIFKDIPAGFKQYPESQFKFILGSATGIDVAKKTVSVTTSEGVQVEQVYDTLVIATGSSSTAGSPWKPSLKGYEATKQALHETQDLVKGAKSIVVGGGGPTGVESAGEIAFEFGRSKEVTLVTAGDQLLVGVPANVAAAAENELRKLGVKVIYGTKVESSNGTEVSLSDGKKITADLYLPTTGVEVNTSFVPKEFLNEKREVVVDDFLKVKGAESVWAAGDATALEDKQLVFSQKQAAHLAKNLDLVLKGKGPVAYKLGDPMMAVTVGRSKGTGRSGNMKLPSIVIWFVKCRTLFIQQQKGLVDGSSA